MTLVLEAAVLGILTGGVYALMASGLTLIFGVMRIINVGHGALVILGAYLSFVLWRNLSIDPFVSLVVTMPVMFVFGVILQVVFIRHLKTDREALSVLVTYSIALGIEGLLGYFFTSNYLQITAWYDTASRRSLLESMLTECRLSPSESAWPPQLPVAWCSASPTLSTREATTT